MGTAAYDAKLDLVYLPMGVTTPISGAVTAHRNRNVMPARFWRECHNRETGVELPDRSPRPVDMDLPAQPTLADITVNGQKVQLFTLRRKPATFLCSIVVMATGGSGTGKTGSPRGCQRRLLTPTQPFSELSFRPTKDLSGRICGEPPCLTSWCAA